MAQVVRVIGLGNEFRGDDAAGLVAARRLRAMSLPAEVEEAPQADGAALIERWQGADVVILLDAVRSGKAPGTVHRIDPLGSSPPALSGCCSSHALTLAEAVAMARALGRLPKRLIFYGVEAADLRQGAACSAAVVRGIEWMVAAVAADARRLSTEPMSTHA